MSPWSKLVGAVLVLAGTAAAQSSSTLTGSPTTSVAPSGTSTASATGATHTVQVGQGGNFKFTPDTVNASVGDYITWTFYPGGHTVVRAEFGYPCIPWNMSTDLPGFFYSGQISPQDVTQDLPTYTIRVNDTAPIFYYCSAPGSCINQHMIGVINPNTTETLDDQVAFAESTSAIQLDPGQPWPSETADPFTTSTAAATATAQAAAATSSAASSSSSSSSSLSAGAIAGIAIGGAAVVILAAALIYICGRHGGQVSAFKHTSRSYSPPAPIEEVRYASSAGPKSPGQETFGSSRYQHSPANDVFNMHDRSPSGSHYVGSPPPMSPGSHPAYGVFPTAGNQVHSPLMGTSDDGRGYYDQAPQETPPPPAPHYETAHPEPVELPSSSDPGNSPIPGYQPPMRQLSWAAGAESAYRPSSKN